MRKLLALLVSFSAVGFSASAAQASGWHSGPPCPYVHNWHLPRKAYGEWADFKLFTGSWKERHRVVRRDRRGVVVKVVRPAARYGCV
ncbi:MAG: hypothetical protein ACKVP3_26435 [Hyphomicrobiaceae bacterium]